MSTAECVNLDTILPSARETAMALRIEPLQDLRWDDLVQRHPHASLFHSSAWLKALARTYNYKPVAFVNGAAGHRLESGIVFCQIDSWLTGRRLVSLPFSDHCEPLVEGRQEMDAIASALTREFRGAGWRYIEMRPVLCPAPSMTLPQSAIPYTLHQLDLSPSVATLFSNCHKDSTQRKIRRSEREGLRHQEGRSEELLDHFYRLHAVNRQRHHRPPQPRDWFHHLLEGFGPDLQIRVAFHQDRAIAAILTIRHKDTLVYKYGGSDPQFNNLGSMHLLLWGAIQDAKSAGLRCFDFGRTEMAHEGLITFKKRWGATQYDLLYTRYGQVDRVTPMFEDSKESWKSKVAKSILSRMQPGALSLAGKFLYKHVG